MAAWVGVSCVTVLSLLLVAFARTQKLEPVPMKKVANSNICQANMDMLKETLRESAKEYKQILEEKSEKLDGILNQMRSSHDQEKEVRFEKLAETALKNEMLSSKLSNNNLLVEVIHLVAMFLGDKIDTVDKNLKQLTEESATRHTVIEQMEEQSKTMMETLTNLQEAKVEETSDKFVELDEKLKKIELDFIRANTEILRKLESLELHGDEMEKALNSTVLAEIESGFQSVQEKLTAGEENAVSRDAETHTKIQDLKLDELAAKVSGVHEKMAGFEESLQTQQSLLQKMENRSMESFSEVKTRLKKMAGCNRAVKLNLTSLETGTYYFSNFYLNWSRASEFCKRNGMLLATLESEEEMDLLDNAAPNQNFYFWLSASDAGRIPGHYYWADGRKVDKNWWYRGSQTEPDSYTKGQDTCVFLYTYYGKLFDGACSGTRYFICELLPGCADLKA